MAAKPAIGVTGNARRWCPGWWFSALALRLCGARPVRITTRHRPEGFTPHGLVIGGGNDIGPEHYGGDLEAKVKSDPQRDALEIEWIRKAIDRRIPLLGICRGAQLINVVMGGSLHQDIRGMRRLTYNRPGLLPTKQVRLEGGSRMETICRTTRLRVNSLHHQAVDRAAKGLRVSGRDLDDIVQSVENPDEPGIIGVQWHPEYLVYLPSQLALFRWLVRASGGNVA